MTDDLRDKKYPSKMNKKKRTKENILDNINLEEFKTKPGEIFIIDTNSNIKPRISISDGPKFSKGGRAGLKGGGICKKGMNRKAIGKNS